MNYRHLVYRMSEYFIKHRILHLAQDMSKSNKSC